MTTLNARIEAARAAALSATKPAPLKGRMTIRKNGSPTGANGMPAAKIIPRWKFDSKSGTTMASLEAHYFAALDVVDRIEQRTEINGKDMRLTKEGRRADVLQYALNDLVPALHRARMAAKKAKAEVDARRAKLKLEEPDKSDLVGASNRRELREYVRSLSAADQAKFFVECKDSILVAAILEAPPALSGVSRERYDQFRQRALDARHGPEMAEIADLDAGIAAMEAVTEAARDEVRTEIGGLTAADFDTLAQPIESRITAPWLRKFKESDGKEVVRVIVPGKNHSPQIATPEQLETGIFFKDFDEYAAATGQEAAA
jgi:hypothetical protein